MEYLQYLRMEIVTVDFAGSFKPYYKWNTFNTVINGLVIMAE